MNYYPAPAACSAFVPNTSKSRCQVQSHKSKMHECGLTNPHGSHSHNKKVAINLPVWLTEWRGARLAPPGATPDPGWVRATAHCGLMLGEKHIICWPGQPLSRAHQTPKIFCTLFATPCMTQTQTAAWLMIACAQINFLSILVYIHKSSSCKANKKEA